MHPTHLCLGQRSIQSKRPHLTSSRHSSAASVYILKASSRLSCWSSSIACSIRNLALSRLSCWTSTVMIYTETATLAPLPRTLCSHSNWLPQCTLWSNKMSTFFLLLFQQTLANSTIFGIQYTEETCNIINIHLSTSPTYCCKCTLGNVWTA